MKTFEKEFKEYFIELQTPLKVYLNKKYTESNSKDYFSFFDNFLSNYGVLAFDGASLYSTPKCRPYINCSKRNIFNLASDERIYLSDDSHNLTECHKIIAKFLIKKINLLSVEDFENWCED